MDKKENDALSSTNSNASLTTSTATTIPHQPSTNQVFPGGGLSKKRSMKNRKVLSPTAKVPSLAIKIYDEQLLYGWDYTCQVIRNTDKNEFHIIAVCHNRIHIVRVACSGNLLMKNGIFISFFAVLTAKKGFVSALC